MQMEIQTRQRSYLALWLMALFATLGNILTTWLAPIVIVWYWTPPAQLGFNCTEPIQWALSKFRWAQVGGLLAGALLGLVVYFLVRRKRQPAAVSG